MVLATGLRPCTRVAASELGSMAARASSRGSLPRIGVSVEAAVTAQADEYSGPCLSKRVERQSELDGVVARVEDKQRRGISRWEQPHETSDLDGSQVVNALSWTQPLDIKWRGPTVPCETQLWDPLIRPARDNGLAGGMTGGVVLTLHTGRGPMDSQATHVLTNHVRT
jgi:hypothetical protein